MSTENNNLEDATFGEMEFGEMDFGSCWHNKQSIGFGDAIYAIDVRAEADDHTVELAEVQRTSYSECIEFLKDSHDEIMEELSSHMENHYNGSPVEIYPTKVTVVRDGRYGISFHMIEELPDRAIVIPENGQVHVIDEEHGLFLMSKPSPVTKG